MVTNEEITDIVIEVAKVNPDLAARILKIYLDMKDVEKQQITVLPAPVYSIPYWGTNPNPYRYDTVTVTCKGTQEPFNLK